MTLRSLGSILSLQRRAVWTNPWRLLAIIFALINLKSLPFAWHLRLLASLLRHVRSSRLRRRDFRGPGTLFKPMITSSRSGPLECDYNLHKSNSTYFSDFDVGRLQLLTSLIGHGMMVMSKDLKHPSSTNHAAGLNLTPSERTASFSIVLGAVSCSFRREIKPFEGFEVWSRIISWDHKWLYVVGHFVKKGAVIPKDGYLYQPGVSKQEKAAAQKQGPRAKPHPAIFASALSKYCFKKGRITIPPERVLAASDLLPARPTEKPNNVQTGILSSTDHVTATMADNLPLPAQNQGAGAATTAIEAKPSTATVMGESFVVLEEGQDIWDWDRVIAEKSRGMELAQLLGKLDNLTEEFPGSECQALGRY